MHKRKYIRIIWILCLAVYFSLMVAGIPVQASESADLCENADVFSSGSDDNSEYETTGKAEKEVVIQFFDGDGKKFEGKNITSIRAEWGQSVILPHVPDKNAPDMWKLNKNKSLDNSINFQGGDKITLKKEDNLKDFVQNGILNLYMPKKCKITLYNNSGTAVFPGGVLHKYEKETIILPDMSSSKYIYYGWTNQKNSAKALYNMNMKYTVTWDQSLYIVRRTGTGISFYDQTGKSTRSFSRLNQVIGKGLFITLPKVPEKTGYQVLGWSKRKNDSKASFKAGAKVAVNSQMSFYAVYRKYSYKVTFNNNSGTSKSRIYGSLKTYAMPNQFVTLPSLPKVTGYVNLGWTTSKGKTTPLYKEGSRFKVTKNTKFYSVKRKSKYYKVTFYRCDGKTDASYQKLSKTVENGTVLSFPQVPARRGYINLGWSTGKNASKSTSNKTFTVNKNMYFYSVQKKQVTVTLRKNNGTIYRRVNLPKGFSYTLPGVKNATGYTFMGWSSKAGQSARPEYEAEENIIVNRSIDLYAVVFDQSSEPDIPACKLPQVNIYKYSQVIFVGDSRTQYMKNVLQSVGGNVTRNVKFICKVGEGLSWFKQTGYLELFNMIKGETGGLLKKKTAVIFNLGVNDLKEYKNYVTYFNSLVPIFQRHGCELYYMSVNPVSRPMLKSVGKADRSEKTLRYFNRYLKENLNSSYQYIDMYSYLKSTGYGFSCSHYGEDSTDDGLHYTAKTYKRIFARCLQSLKYS